MLRKIAVLIFIAMTAAACADVEHADQSTVSREYCITGTHNGCSALEGDGDCQPCPATAQAQLR
jgi:hypothetical protein